MQPEVRERERMKVAIQMGILTQLNRSRNLLNDLSVHITAHKGSCSGALHSAVYSIAEEIEQLVEVTTKGEGLA
jgi:hypothetical protein